LGDRAMSKAKVNDLEKRVAASVARQYVLEAKMLHMSLSSYIAWLKLKAGYSTPYDHILASRGAQPPAPASAQSQNQSQGAGQSGGQGRAEQGQSAQAGAGAEAGSKGGTDDAER